MYGCNYGGTTLVPEQRYWQCPEVSTFQESLGLAELEVFLPLSDLAMIASL